MKTVDFLTAINSGKRFKTDIFIHCGWFWINKHGYLVCENDEYQDDTICNKEFINAQFELEEKSITITESEFDEAFNKCFMGHRKLMMLSKKDIKEELGF